MKKTTLLVIATTLAIIGCMSITSYAAQEKFFSTTFEEFGIGYNCNEPNLIDDTGGSVTAKVAADPADANNQCMMLYAHRPNPVIPTNMVHPYMHFGNNDYTSIVLRYKAYIDPNSAETWQFALRSESGNISVATLSDSSFSALGQTRTVSPGWHEYEWRVTDATIDILIDGVPVTPTPRNVNYATVKSLRLGVVGHENDPRLLYIDDLVYFEISDKPDIKANKTSGEIDSDEKIELISSDGSAIYYTCDGSEPSISSSIYDSQNGIVLEQDNIQIKAVCINSDGESGGVYNFGRYYLKKYDDLSFVCPTISNFDYAADETVNAQITVLNSSSDEKNIVVVMGLYADNMLCGISNIDNDTVCDTQRKDVQLSAVSGEDLLLGDKCIKVFVLKKEYLAASNNTYYTEIKHFEFDSNGNLIPNKPKSFNSSTGEANLDLSLNIDSSNRKAVFSAPAIDNPQDNQELVVMGKDENNDVRIFDVIYPDDSGAVRASIPFSANTSGGDMTFVISGKGNIYSEQKKYYVNKEKEPVIVEELLRTTTSSELKDKIKEYIDLQVFNFVWNDEAKNILFNTKEEKKNGIDSLTKFIDIYNTSCSIANLYSVTNDDYYTFLNNNKSDLPFLSEQLYDLDSIDVKQFSQSMFKSLINEIDENDRSYNKTEQCYKTVYAISKLNCALKTQIPALLSTYNDVFKLDLAGDYASVSEYEVAKALEGKEFTNIQDIKTAFNARVKQLINEKNSNSQNSNTGSKTGSKTGNAATSTPKVHIEVSNADNADNADYYDVNSSHWAYDYIRHLTKTGIISGSTDGKFYPEEQVTRAEFAKMIVEAMNLNLIESESNFSDVSEKEWYSKYVNTANANNIINGFENTFNPYAKLTRQDMAVIVARAVEKKGYSLSAGEFDFADKETIADYAYESVMKLSNLNIVNGYNDNTFKPQNSLSRAEAAAIIYRYMAYVGL